MSALERQAGDTTHIATASSLYGRERVMRVRRHIDLDIVARADLTAVQDNRHVSGFANDVSLGVMIECRGHQAGHEAIELDTGIAKACDLDESRRPKTQASTGGQREKINAARCDVFSNIPGDIAKPLRRSSSKSSAWMRWTCRRFGIVGSRRTRDWCFTVEPRWASPSTPSPATR